MEIIVEWRDPRDSIGLRNLGVDHINEISLKTIMCFPNANTIIIRKQTYLEKSGVNIKKIGLTLHSRQKIPTVKIIKEFPGKQLLLSLHWKKHKQPNSFINVLWGRLTLVLGIACVSWVYLWVGWRGGCIEWDGKRACSRERGWSNWFGTPLPHASWGREVWKESWRWEAHLEWTSKYILHCFWGTEPKIVNFIGKKHVPSRWMKFLPHEPLTDRLFCCSKRRKCRWGDSTCVRKVSLLSVLRITLSIDSEVLRLVSQVNLFFISFYFHCLKC